jgi:hypothetical protein
MVPIEYPYLSDIGALMYLTNNTRPNIVFTVNYLIRYSATTTMRHWNGIKKGLFLRRNQEYYLIGYADTGYLSDPQNGRS